jgi:uncharacterized protein
MTTGATPILQQERADILDGLRGFALLGILLANSAVFSMYVFQSPNSLKDYSTSSADSFLFFLSHIFVEGKFYSIFSLLFGIGFSIIFLRNKNKGRNGLLFFYRRLFILLLFGLCHSLLLWDGDILFFYALAGMFLPLFRNIGNRTLLCLALLLLVSPIAFDFLKIISDGKWNIANSFLVKATAIDKKNGIEGLYPGNWLIIHDTYTDILKWSQSGFWWSWYLRLDSNRIVKVFAMFLLGLYVGRNELYLHLRANKTFLERIRRWGYVIGIPAGIAFAWFATDKKSLPHPAGIWDTITYLLNVAPLALAYAATIALWYINRKFQKTLSLLQPVGRMALTNYIMQSVMGVAIYYGIGIGLGGKFGPAGYIPIAIVLFSFQVLFSNWWLRYFNYGPMEWIWRIATYGKKLSLIKNKQ